MSAAVDELWLREYCGLRRIEFRLSFFFLLHLSIRFGWRLIWRNWLSLNKLLDNIKFLFRKYFVMIMIHEPAELRIDVISLDQILLRNTKWQRRMYSGMFPLKITCKPATVSEQGFRKRTKNHSTKIRGREGDALNIKLCSLPSGRKPFPSLTRGKSRIRSYMYSTIFHDF